MVRDGGKPKNITWYLLLSGDIEINAGRHNAHAGYVNEPSLLTTEPSSAMTVMTGFTSDVGILHLLNTTDCNQ